MKICPDSRPPRGQEWGELEGWEREGCEEFLDRMFLWRPSLHPASCLPTLPATQPGHLPPPAAALAFSFLQNSSPQIHFFPAHPPCQPRICPTV